MRLIDADKLIYQSHAQHIQPYINKKDIDNAPTVEMAEDCISRQALIEKATSWDKHFADSERYVSLTDIQGAPPVTPQPCEDCVKREDVQDIMARLLSDYLHDEDREKIENANAEIGELPSVQPQPKRGKWIEDAETYYKMLNERGLGVDEYTPYFTDDIACSVCLAKYSCIDNETQFFKYCPNCGADMREVQDGK